MSKVVYEYRHYTCMISEVSCFVAYMLGIWVYDMLCTTLLILCGAGTREG